MSSIGNISGSSAMMTRSMQRPDPAQMADNLFSKLDSTGQGYLTKSDLQSALDNVLSASSSSSSTASSSSTSSSADSLFSQLDTNGDGKVTKQEFSDTLKKVAEQLDNQFMSMRMNGGGAQGGGGMSGMGGMPPPPPQGGQNDTGFTKDELTSQLKEIGSSDSKLSSLISNIANNFDKADTNSDGKVSFKEAMAYDQSTSSSSSSSSTNSTNSTSSDNSSSSSSTSSTNDLSAQVLQQIMKLMQAYASDQTGSNSLISTLSVTA